MVGKSGGGVDSDNAISRTAGWRWSTHRRVAAVIGMTVLALVICLGIAPAALAVNIKPVQIYYMPFPRATPGRSGHVRRHRGELSLLRPAFLA